MWLFLSVNSQSEERGKDEATKEQSMRAAGSSPCVGADSSFNVRNNVADPEQGIYHGFYRLGMWICITDRDVWHRSDFGFNEGKVLSKQLLLMRCLFLLLWQCDI